MPTNVACEVRRDISTDIALPVGRGGVTECAPEHAALKRGHPTVPLRRLDLEALQAEAEVEGFEATGGPGCDGGDGVSLGSQPAIRITVAVRRA